jgi:hypothetical protein
LTRGVRQRAGLGVKGVVSIPKLVFDEAERLSHRLGLHRDDLYTLALRAYVSRHAEHDMTAAINAALEGIDPEEDLPFIRAAGQQALKRFEW